MVDERVSNGCIAEMCDLMNDGNTGSLEVAHRIQRILLLDPLMTVGNIKDVYAQIRCTCQNNAFAV